MATNSDIGTCPCSTPGCNETAAVRRMNGKKQNAGRLYLWCPDCGVVRTEGQKFQNYILEAATIDGQPKPAPQPEPKPEPPAPEPEKKRGLLDVIFGDDDE